MNQQGWNDLARGAAVGGSAAAVASLAALAVRGRADNRSAVAPINATSHIVWGDRALRVDRPTVRHTVPGLALHAGSAVLWAAVQHGLFGTRRGVLPNARNAALTSALAALVDLKLVPDRLTPGFERRLSTRSLMWVYGALAVGLAIGGELAARSGGRRGAGAAEPAEDRAGRIEPSAHSTVQVDDYLEDVDDRTHAQAGGSPAIKPNTDLAADGKPDVAVPRNPNL
jgi:hypothetical protein